MASQTSDKHARLNASLQASASFEQDQNVLRDWTPIKETDTETRRGTEVRHLKSEKETWKRLEISLIKGTQPPPVYRPFRLLLLFEAVRRFTSWLRPSFFSFFFRPLGSQAEKTAFWVSKQPLIYLSGKCGTKSESQWGSEKPGLVLFCGNLQAWWQTDWLAND